MTSFDPSPTQDPSARRGWDEAALLGFVEGALGLADETRLLAALEGDPAMKARVLAMRRDRELVASLRDEAPNSGTLDAVATKLRVSRAASGSFPVAARTRLIREYAPLAAAAVLALAGTVVVVVLASRHATENEIAADNLVVKVPLVRATIAAKVDEPSPEITNDPHAAPDIPGPVVIAADTSETKPVDAAHALELARQHKLIIRVVARSPSQADRQLSELAELASRRDMARVWGVNFQTPSTVVAMLESPGTVLGESLPRWHRPEPTRVADSHETQANPPAFPAPERKVFVAEFVQSAQGLSGFRDLVKDRLGEVEFLESAKPLPMAPSPADADRLLWWTQPSASWSPHARVPVILDLW